MIRPSIAVLVALASSAPATSGVSGRGTPLEGYAVPEGFVVERASDLAESFLALAVGTDGRLFLSIEDGPILVARDVDGDGSYETRSPFTSEVVQAQGLVWHAGSLYAVGRRDGVVGLYSLTPGADADRAQSPVTIATFREGGEHGAHGAAVGPDGALYVTLGNLSGTETTPASGSPLEHRFEGNVLPLLSDPSGYGAESTYPYGVIARVDPRTRGVTWFAAGLRNAYDLAFDAEGELFTCDSDMEWDLGLPWYRPVRVLHLVRDGDYGARTGSNLWPPSYPDTLPEVVAIGRGSPTGVAFWNAAELPERWRGRLLVGDWSRGKILAVALAARGAGYSGEVETLLSGGETCAVTDLVEAPDGSILFTTGGRGVIGDLLRIVWRGQPPASDVGSDRDVPPTRRAERQDDVPSATTAPSLDAREPRARRRACEKLTATAISDARVRARLIELLGDEDRLVRHAARSALARTHPIDLYAPILAASDPALVIEGSLLLARTLARPGSGLGFGSDALLERLTGLFAVEKGGEHAAAIVRSIEVVVLGLGEPSRPETRERVVATLLASFPGDDRDAAREIAYLLAHWAPPGAFARLAAALASEADDEQEIAYAWCAATLAGQASDAELRSLLAWFERTEGSGGSASFDGYVAAMRALVLETIDARRALTLADVGSDAASPGDRAAHAGDGEASIGDGAAGIGPKTLALLLAKIGTGAPDRLFARLREQYAALGDGVTAVRTRALVLQALGDAPLPRAKDWLRELARADGSDPGSERMLERVSALTALARSPSREDAPLFVAGLTLADAELPAACVRALAATDARPEDAETWTRLVDAAHKLGRSRGPALVHLLLRWIGRDPGPAVELANPDDWQRNVNALEQWLRWKYPETVARRAASVDAPRWSAEDVATFLARSAERKGSIARGAEVYVRANCASCHAIDRPGFEVGAPSAVVLESLGPDLSSVGRRLGLAELVETITAPSKTISDLYRTEVVVTHDDERIEGRLVAEDPDAITLQVSGERRRIARADVALQRRSEISSMPEGLLETLTLEEVKDLFAFLRAEPGAGLAERAEPAWIPLFQGQRRSAWKYDGAHWREEQGVIVGRAENLARPSWLVAKTVWTDFEIEFDVRLLAGNSGLQFRSTVDPASDDPIGYQADLGQGHWGSLFSTDGRGAIATPAPETWHGAVDLGGWNHVHVRADGDRHRIELNGVTMVDVRDPGFASGVFAFQLHQGMKMEVRIANVRARALRAE